MPRGSATWRTAWSDMSVTIREVFLGQATHKPPAGKDHRTERVHASLKFGDLAGEHQDDVGSAPGLVLDAHTGWKVQAQARWRIEERERRALRDAELGRQGRPGSTHHSQPVCQEGTVGARDVHCAGGDTRIRDGEEIRQSPWRDRLCPRPSASLLHGVPDVARHHDQGPHR